MSNESRNTADYAPRPDTSPSVESPGKPRDIAILIFIFLPILSLALNAVSWLRFGLDIPILDDWRSYMNGGIGTFSLKYLFRPAIDTLYPVGLALDSFAELFLDGNSIAYQFLTMIVVLGLLLLLQWRLLLVTLRDRLVAASAFSFSLLMLQPGSYWGIQNIAYQQALPLVFGLTAIYIIIGTGWSRRWSVPCLFALGVLSGMSYISGAFSIAVIGAVFFIMARFIEPSERRPLKSGGLSLLAAGFFTLIPQILVTMVVLHDRHRPGAPISFPSRIDFWLYFLGKIGRSLMLPDRFAVLSLIITILVVIAVCVLAGITFARFRKGRIRSLRDAGTSLVFLAILSQTFVYLLLVSAGRANLHPPEVKTAAQIFSLGFARFHFFWVTLLWPWAIALCFETVSRSRPMAKNSRRLGFLAIVLPAILLPLFISFGALKHASYHRNASYQRLEEIQAIISQIQKGNGIDCPAAYPPGKEKRLMAAFVYGKSIDASFARGIPLLPLPIGTSDPAPLFRSSDAKKGGPEMTGATPTSKDGYRFEGSDNPGILVKTGAPEKMRECLAVEVSALVRIAEPEAEAKIYYETPGKEGFSEKESQVVKVRADKDKAAEMSFELFSPSGFMDELRFQPVDTSQKLDLAVMEVRCRISK